MDGSQVLVVVFRWLHVVPAAVLVGGTIFLQLVVLPVAGGSEAAAEWHAAVRRRWARLVMISVGLLLVSGLYNAAWKAMHYQLSTAYNIVLALKIVLALFVFLLASLLAGRGKLAERVQQRERGWGGLAALLAIAVVCLAGLLKNFPQTPKPHRSSAGSAWQAESTGGNQMDRKAKKKLEILNKKLQLLRNQLAGARHQDDEPGEIERLQRQIAEVEAEVEKLKRS